MAKLRARVLIVDDERANPFEEFEPDIVLLDLHMPWIDGRTVLGRLNRLLERRGLIPLAIVAADTSRVARNGSLLIGADDFLTKPLDRIGAERRVRNLLQTRELFAELAAACLALERDQPEQPQT